MFNNVMSLSVKISIFLIIKYNYNFMQNKKKTEANKRQKKDSNVHGLEWEKVLRA